MRGHLIALVLATAGALQAQDRCAHATRNALIGGSVGATLVVTVILSAPRTPENPAGPPSRITSTRALMVTWAGAWGAGLGSVIAGGGNPRCFPPWEGDRDAAGHCGSAVRSGAWRGAVSGGANGFLMSPILALPLLIPLAPGNIRPVNLDHVMGLITAAGVVIGAPVGALKAAGQCHAS